MATYYLDQTAGSDAAAGTSSGAAWKTIAKANASHTTGDTLLFKRGEKWREALEVAGDDVTITAYGTTPILDTSVSGLIHTNGPVISGADILTGFTLYNPPASAPELLVNANLDTWSSSIQPTSWVTNSGPPTQVITEESTIVRSGNSCKLSDNGTGFSAFIRQDVTGIAAGVDYVLSFYHEDTTAKRCSYNIQIIGGAFANQFLQVDGSWGATNPVTASAPTNSTGAFAQFSRTFTTPAGSSMTLRVKIQGLDPTGPYYIDDASLHLATAASVNANTYRAASTTQSLVASKNDVTLFFGGSETTLDDQQFYWKAGWFYLRNTAGNPDTNSDVVEAATRLHCINASQKHRTNVSYITCEKSNGRGINITSAAGVEAQAPSVTHCWLRQVGFEGTNPITLVDTGETGAINFTYVDDGIVEYNRFEDGHTDEFFGFNARRVSVQSNYHFTTYDFFADNIQLFYTPDRLTDANYQIKYNRCIQQGTNSDKGNMLALGDGGTISFNDLRYGNYGVAALGNNVVVEFNTCYYHGLAGGFSGTDTFGAGLYLGIGNDPTAVFDNMMWRYNAIIQPLHGIAIYGTAAKTNIHFYHNTIFDPAGWGFKSDAPLSGAFKNNIIWASPLTPLGVYKVPSIPGGGSWASDYNILGPEGTNFYSWLGTSYSTLAAYKAASSQDAHSTKGDPLFRGSTVQDVSLSGTSPAIDAGVAITGIGEIVSGAAPDQGAYEYYTYTLHETSPSLVYVT